MNFMINQILRKFPDENENLLLVASEMSGVILGTVCLRIKVSKSGINAAVFSSLFVAEEARRQKVGFLLLRECEAQAHKAGCQLITAYVKPSNTGAMAFYYKCGYQVGYLFDDGDLGICKQLSPVSA